MAIINRQDGPIIARLVDEGLLSAKEGERYSKITLLIVPDAYHGRRMAKDDGLTILWYEWLESGDVDVLVDRQDFFANELVFLFGNPKLNGYTHYGRVVVTNGEISYAVITETATMLTTEFRKCKGGVTIANAPEIARYTLTHLRPRSAWIIREYPDSAYGTALRIIYNVPYFFRFIAESMELYKLGESVDDVQLGLLESTGRVADSGVRRAHFRYMKATRGCLPRRLFIMPSRKSRVSIDTIANTYGGVVKKHPVRRDKYESW